MEDLLGYSRDEFLGKELWELGLLQDSRANQEAFVELQKNGHIRYNDLPLQTKHGERRDIEFISNVCSAAEPKRRLPNLSTQNMAVVRKNPIPDNICRFLNDFADCAILS